MATKHFINKLVAAGGARNGLAKSKGLGLTAVLGIMSLWSFFSLASVPAAHAQNAANLAIASPGATVDGNIVNFRTTSGLNDADWRYWWVVRGPKSQWTFAGPSGNLDLPPGDYRATVTARDRYGDTTYQDTSTFRVESPTAAGTVGGRSAGSPNYRNDGRMNREQIYDDGSYGRYGDRGNDYYDRYGDGYRDGEEYDDRYGDRYDGYDNGGYDGRYENGRYDGAYDRDYGNGYDSTRYGNEYGNAYDGNLDGEYYGYDGGYDTAGYGGGDYEDGQYQDGGGHEGGPCDGGSLDNYEGNIITR